MEESYGTRTGVGTDGGTNIADKEILYTDAFFKLCLYIFLIFDTVSVADEDPFIFNIIIIALYSSNHIINQGIQ